MTTPSREPRPHRTVARYAAGSIGTGGFATLPGLVLVFFLTDTLGVAAIWAGVLVTVAKVWDVLIDPVIGARSDHSLAVTGSRRRFMLLGAILLPVFFVLTFAVPAALGPVPGRRVGARRVRALRDGVQPVPGAVHRAARRARAGLRRPHPAAVDPRRRADLRDPAVRRGRPGAARRVPAGRAPRLPGDGGRRRRSCSAPGCWWPSSARRAACPASPATRASIAENYRLGVQALRRSQPFRALLRPSCCRGSRPASCSPAPSTSPSGCCDSGVTFLFLALVAPALLCAPLWAIISRRIGKERAFTIASIIFALAALSLLGLIWAPGPWLYAPGRDRRRRLRGHAVAADGDAARRDLARRPHARRRQRRDLRRRLDGRGDRGHGARHHGADDRARDQRLRRVDRPAGGHAVARRRSPAS